jgi:hypothetical protein
MSVCTGVSAFFEIGMLFQPASVFRTKMVPALVRHNDCMLEQYSSGCIPGKFCEKADECSFGTSSSASCTAQAPDLEPIDFAAGPHPNVSRRDHRSNKKRRKSKKFHHWYSKKLGGSIARFFLFND